MKRPRSALPPGKCTHCAQAKRDCAGRGREAEIVPLDGGPVSELSYLSGGRLMGCGAVGVRRCREFRGASKPEKD